MQKWESADAFSFPAATFRTFQDLENDQHKAADLKHNPRKRHPRNDCTIWLLGAERLAIFSPPLGWHLSPALALRFSPVNQQKQLSFKYRICCVIFVFMRTDRWFTQNVMAVGAKLPELEDTGCGCPLLFQRSAISSTRCCILISIQAFFFFFLWKAIHLRISLPGITSGKYKSCSKNFFPAELYRSGAEIHLRAIHTVHEGTENDFQINPRRIKCQPRSEKKFVSESPHLFKEKGKGDLLLQFTSLAYFWRQKKRMSPYLNLKISSIRMPLPLCSGSQYTATLWLEGTVWNKFTLSKKEKSLYA